MVAHQPLGIFTSGNRFTSGKPAIRNCRLGFNPTRGADLRLIECDFFSDFYRHPFSDRSLLPLLLPQSGRGIWSGFVRLLLRALLNPFTNRDSRVEKSMGNMWSVDASCLHRCAEHRRIGTLGSHWSSRSSFGVFGSFIPIIGSLISGIIAVLVAVVDGRLSPSV